MAAIFWPMRPLLVFITAPLWCAGCATKESNPTTGDTATEADSPWSDLEPIERNAFRVLRTSTFSQATSVHTLVAEEHFGPVFGLGPGGFYATDHLFRHDPRPVCVNPSQPNRSSAPDGSGCPPETTRVSRGAPALPAQPLAIAKDHTDSRVAILTAAGAVHWVDTDPLSGEAIDFMRPSAPVPLEGLVPDNPILAVHNGRIAVGQGSVISVYGPSGLIQDATETEFPVVDAAWIADELWWLTAEAAWSNGEQMGPGGRNLLDWNDTAWVVQSDALWSASDTIAVAGLLGPATAAGSDAFAIGARGLLRIQPNGTATELWEGSAIDIDSNSIGEVAVLHADNRFTVFVDETALGNEGTLNAWVSTFMERPRNPSDSVTCDSLSAMLNTAETNAEWLDAVPAAIALGVTPSHMQQADACGFGHRSTALANRFDGGVLFHHTPDQCQNDLDCHTQALQEDLTHLGFSPAWASGLGTHTELNVDWVESLRRAAPIDRYAFLGMGARPEVPHGNDLRGKDAWGSALGDQSRAWRIDRLDQLTNPASTGGLAVLPGNNIPAFNLGGCANLWLYECHPLGRGGGQTVLDDDIESLDLLLLRALASTDGSGVHTWNFHLPDIALYDYAADCANDGNQWTGDDCQAGRLQEWLTQVHRRFGLDGAIEWTGPGTVNL